MDLVAGMRALIAVVEEGSFSGAAERLDISKAMISKQISSLEAHLGTRLLNRTTRRLSLTESGTLFYERSLQILADISEAEQAAGGLTARPRGTLKMTVPLTYAQHKLVPVFAAYRQAYPEVRLDIHAGDRKLDLVEEGFDMAIRIGILPESGLVARKLDGVRSVVCASPAYIEKHGKPVTPQDLVRHECMAYSLSQSSEEWRLLDAQGNAHVVRCSGAVRADNGDLLRLAALEGEGIVFQPGFIVQDDLDKQRLIRLLPDFASDELGVYAVYPSRQYLSAKVRSFVDFVAQALAE